MCTPETAEGESTSFLFSQPWIIMVMTKKKGVGIIGAGEEKRWIDGEMGEW